MLFEPSDKNGKNVIRWMRRWPACPRRIFSALMVVACGMAGRAFDHQRFETDHVDLQVVATTDPDRPLAFRLFSYDLGRDVALTNAVIAVAESARLSLPGGTPFGSEGESLWVLPQSQEPQVVYLGISAERISGEVFESPVSVTLRAVEGPGHFYLWQANQFGGLEIKMNSRDGIDGNDRTTPLIGSHEHLNWGFSTSGVYRVTLQASGRRTGEGTEALSAPETLTFHVLPLPERPFERWQREHFGDSAPDARRGPQADPDGDGVTNVLEYAFGTDPNIPSVSVAPTLAVTSEGDQSFPLLRIKRTASATDLRFVVETTESLAPALWTNFRTVSVLDPDGNADFIEIRDPRPITENARRFYRIVVELKNGIGN